MKEFTKKDFENDYIADEEYYENEGKDAFLYAVNFAFGGSAENMRALGDCYSTRGHGVKVDYDKAVFWYQRAVDSGDWCSAQRLAEILYRADGAPKDFERALSLYKIASDNGADVATSRLGSMYLYGHGVEKDFRKARALIEKSAKSGEREACYEYAHILKAEGADGWTEYLKKSAEQSWGKAAWEYYNHLISQGCTDGKALMRYLYVVYYDEKNVGAEIRAQAGAALEELKRKK